MTEHGANADSAHSDRVGSVAEEAFKLFRAMATPPQASGEHHACTTTWCPVCQVAGFVRDNPEALVKVSDSAAQLARSLRELIETALTPRDET